MYLLGNFIIDTYPLHFTRKQLRYLHECVKPHSVEVAVFLARILEIESPDDATYDVIAHLAMVKLFQMAVVYRNSLISPEADAILSQCLEILK